ncbi:MAG: hypothetical protein V1861_02795 [Candidatus Micrarchaeota archaeon]
MKNANLKHKQMKAMAEVIKEFGGSKKIKAMPLEDKLTVVKEIELASRGLPTGPVKLLTSDNIEALCEVEFGPNSKTPEGKEEFNKNFDEFVKCVELIETVVDGTDRLDKAFRKVAVKALPGMIAVGLGLKLSAAGTQSMIAVGITSLAVGCVFVALAFRDLYKINKAVNEDLLRIKNI